LEGSPGSPALQGYLTLTRVKGNGRISIVKEGGASEPAVTPAGNGWRLNESHFRRLLAGLDVALNVVGEEFGRVDLEARVRLYLPGRSGKAAEFTDTIRLTVVPDEDAEDTLLAYDLNSGETVAAAAAATGADIPELYVVKAADDKADLGFTLLNPCWDHKWKLQGAPKTEGTLAVDKPSAKCNDLDKKEYTLVTEKSSTTVHRIRIHVGCPRLYQLVLGGKKIPLPAAGLAPEPAGNDESGQHYCTYRFPSTRNPGVTGEYPVGIPGFPDEDLKAYGLEFTVKCIHGSPGQVHSASVSLRKGSHFGENSKLGLIPVKLDALELEFARQETGGGTRMTKGLVTIGIYGNKKNDYLEFQGGPWMLVKKVSGKIRGSIAIDLVGGFFGPSVEGSLTAEWAQDITADGTINSDGTCEVQANVKDQDIPLDGVPPLSDLSLKELCGKLGFNLFRREITNSEFTLHVTGAIKAGDRKLASFELKKGEDEEKQDFVTGQLAFEESFEYRNNLLKVNLSKEGDICANGHGKVNAASGEVKLTLSKWKCTLESFYAHFGAEIFSKDTTLARACAEVDSSGTSSVTFQINSEARLFEAGGYRGTLNQLAVSLEADIFDPDNKIFKLDAANFEANAQMDFNLGKPFTDSVVRTDVGFKSDAGLSLAILPGSQVKFGFGSATRYELTARESSEGQGTAEIGVKADLIDEGILEVNRAEVGNWGLYVQTGKTTRSEILLEELLIDDGCLEKLRAKGSLRFDKIVFEAQGEYDRAKELVDLKAKLEIKGDGKKYLEGDASIRYSAANGLEKITVGVKSAKNEALAYGGTLTLERTETKTEFRAEDVSVEYKNVFKGSFTLVVGQIADPTASGGDESYWYVFAHVMAEGRRGIPIGQTGLSLAGGDILVGYNVTLMKHWRDNEENKKFKISFKSPKSDAYALGAGIIVKDASGKLLRLYGGVLLEADLGEDLTVVLSLLNRIQAGKVGNAYCVDSFGALSWTLTSGEFTGTQTLDVKLPGGSGEYVDFSATAAFEYAPPDVDKDGKPIGDKKPKKCTVTINPLTGSVFGEVQIAGRGGLDFNTGSGNLNVGVNYRTNKTVNFKKGDYRFWAEVELSAGGNTSVAVSNWSLKNAALGIRFRGEARGDFSFKEKIWFITAEGTGKAWVLVAEEKNRDNGAMLTVSYDDGKIGVTGAACLYVWGSYDLKVNGKEIKGEFGEESDPHKLGYTF
jgi:hypothetical protein